MTDIERATRAQMWLKIFGDVPLELCLELVRFIEEDEPEPRSVGDTLRYASAYLQDLAIDLDFLCGRGTGQPVGILSPGVCAVCGNPTELVRPGKYQCNHCEAPGKVYPEGL